MLTLQDITLLLSNSATVEISKYDADLNLEDEYYGTLPIPGPRMKYEVVRIHPLFNTVKKEPYLHIECR